MQKLKKKKFYKIHTHKCLSAHFSSFCYSGVIYFVELRLVKNIPENLLNTLESLSAETHAYLMIVSREPRFPYSILLTPKYSDQTQLRRPMVCK